MSNAPLAAEPRAAQAAQAAQATNEATDETVTHEATVLAQLKPAAALLVQLMRWTVPGAQERTKGMNVSWSLARAGYSSVVVTEWSMVMVQVIYHVDQPPRGRICIKNSVQPPNTKLTHPGKVSSYRVELGTPGAVLVSAADDARPRWIPHIQEALATR